MIELIIASVSANFFLIGAHIFMWQRRGPYWLISRYVAGTLAILVGQSLAVLNGVDPMLAIWFIPIPCGVVVLTLHVWRRKRVMEGLRLITEGG